MYAEISYAFAYAFAASAASAASATKCLRGPRGGPRVGSWAKASVWKYFAAEVAEAAGAANAYEIYESLGQDILRQQP